MVRKHGNTEFLDDGLTLFPNPWAVLSVLGSGSAFEVSYSHAGRETRDATLPSWRSG